MDISARLQKELAKAKAFNSESNTERKNDLVRLNKKTPLFGRILPLAGEDWFAKEFSQFFMNYTKSDGSRANAVVEVDLDDPNDVLANAVKEVLSWNASHENNKINLSDNDRYGFNVQHKVELVTIPVTQTPQGYKMELSTKVQGMPNLVNYQVSRATYYTILGMFGDGYMIDNKPFDTELSFVTLGKTYPLTAHINKEGKGYDVALRADIQLPAINPHILDKDENGEYKYIDDPNKFHKPTYLASPDFANMLANVIKDRLEDAKKVESNPNVQLPIDYLSKHEMEQPVSPQEDNTFVPGGSTSFNEFEEPKQEQQSSTQVQEQSDPFASNANQQSQDDFGDFGDDFGSFEGSTSFDDFMKNNN